MVLRVDPNGIKALGAMVATRWSPLSWKPMRGYVEQGEVSA
jgi:hypothetical protein